MVVAKFDNFHSCERIIGIGFSVLNQNAAKHIFVLLEI